MLKLVLFVLPLGLDTFAVAAALGLGGLPASERLRVSALMSGFEMAMPLVGLGVGRAVGAAVGSFADWLAVAVLAALGVWMIIGDGEEERAPALATRGGLALVALGFSISLDELAIGFTIGLLRLPLWVAIVLIGAQAFVFAQVGLRLGSRLNETFRERAEQIAGVALLALAVLLVVERVT